uniref:Macaca fascicularis brain cDNA, clone: QflA-20838 n=1 Tax=Macaca fascicularis TaxID=9541 RepID=I7G6N7_MACFA|nr:unnamed protein product [Macaca fascicularis]
MFSICSTLYHKCCLLFY